MLQRHFLLAAKFHLISQGGFFNESYTAKIKILKPFKVDYKTFSRIVLIIKKEAVPLDTLQNLRSGNFQSDETSRKL